MVTTAKTQLLQRSFVSLQLSDEDKQRLLALKPIVAYENEISHLQQEAESKANALVVKIDTLSQRLQAKVDASQSTDEERVISAKLLATLPAIKTFYQSCGAAFESFPFVSVTEAWQTVLPDLVAYTDLYQQYNQHPMFAEKAPSDSF